MSNLIRDVYEGARLKADGNKLSGPFSFCEKKNKNERTYKKGFWDPICEEVKPLIASNQLLGELDHPEEERDPGVYLKYVSHKITDLHVEGDTLYGSLEILDTPMGQVLKTLKEAGVPVMVSSRALGKTNADGYVDEDTYSFITFDCVADPSFPGAILNESTNGKRLVKALRSLFESADPKEREVMKEGTRRMLHDALDLDTDDAAPSKDDLDCEDGLDSEETDEMFIKNVITGMRGIVETSRLFIGTTVTELEEMVQRRDEEINRLKGIVPSKSQLVALQNENAELMRTVESLTMRLQANDGIRESVKAQIDVIVAENEQLSSKLRVATHQIESGTVNERTSRKLSSLREALEQAEDENESLRNQLNEANRQMVGVKTRLICEQHGVDYQKNKQHLSNLMNETEIVEKVKQIRGRSLRQLGTATPDLQAIEESTSHSGGAKRLANTVARVS